MSSIEMSVNQGYVASSRLDSQHAEEKPKRSLTGALSNAFNKVVSKAPSLTDVFSQATLKGAGKIALKIGTIGVGCTLMGPWFAVAAGFGFTSFDAIKEHIKEKEHSNILKHVMANKGKYGVKLGLNSLSAVIGLGGAEMASDFFAGTDNIALPLDLLGAPPVDENLTQLHANASVLLEDMAGDAVLASQGDISPLDMPLSISFEEAQDSSLAEYTPVAGATEELDVAEARITPEDNVAQDSGVNIGEASINSEASAQTAGGVESVNNNHEIEGTAPAEPEIIIPETAMEKLSMLAENEALSEQTREMIAAALKGQEWAIRDAGLGLINGEYGFDNLGVMEGHVDADDWGADLLKQAAESGDSKARIDLAYFEYTGVNDAIALDRDAALETIKELDRTWINGEEVLADIQLQNAKEAFLASMPEGTDINDYKIEPYQGGYKFTDLEPSLGQEHKDALLRSGIDPESCDTIDRNADGFILEGCEPVAI